MIVYLLKEGKPVLAEQDLNLLCQRLGIDSDGLSIIDKCVQCCNEIWALDERFAVITQTPDDDPLGDFDTVGIELPDSSESTEWDGSAFIGYYLPYWYVNADWQPVKRVYMPEKFTTFDEVNLTNGNYFTDFVSAILAIPAMHQAEYCCTTTPPQTLQARETEAQISYRFTVEERSKLGIELTEAMYSQENAQTELAQYTKNKKAEIEAIGNTIASLRRKVNTGGEERTVEAIAVMDFAKRVVTVVNALTGETIEERKMYPSELSGAQLEIKG